MKPATLLKIEQQRDDYLKDRWRNLPETTKHSTGITGFGWANHPLVPLWERQWLLEKIQELMEETERMGQ